MNKINSFLIFGPEEKRNFWKNLYSNETQFDDKFITEYQDIEDKLAEFSPQNCFLYDEVLLNNKLSFRDLINNSYYTWFLVCNDTELADSLLHEFDGICFILQEKYISIDFLSNLIDNSCYLKKLTFDKAQLVKINTKNIQFRQNLLSNVSHELRTPLNGILGFASLLIEDSLSVDQRESIQVIINSSNRLIKVVDNLLDHTDISTSTTTLVETKCDLVKILFSSFELCLNELQNKRLNLIFDIKEPHLWIQSDPSKLKAIFDNLISNAIKFTNSGSIIVRLNLPINNFVSIDIVDSGCGISPEIYPNLFKAFHQGDGSITRKFGGTGLGLYIADQYVQLIGGEIAVKANSDKGCTFSVIVPINTCKSQISHDIPPITKSILVVSDDYDVSTVLSRYQSQNGYSYDVARSYGTHDYILIDFPKDQNLHVDQIAIIEKAKQNKVPCIGLIEFNYMAHRRKSDELGIDFVYTKPFHPNQIELDLDQSKNSDVNSMNTKNQKLNILVLEDERVSQLLFLRCLEAKDHKVSVFSRPLEALKSFQENHFDLLIVDLQIPEMNGFEFTKEIRKLNKTVPVIATSASVYDDIKNSCLESGMTDLLPKPFLKADLYKMLYQYTGIESVDNYNKYRILHIDDENHILDIVSYAIEHSLPGINIKQSNNAIEACTLMGSFQPHIVITDLNMPQMDGLSFVRYLKSDPLYKKTKVFVLTGLPETNSSVNQIRNLDVEKILHKPFKANLLIEHLKKTFDSMH